MTNAKPHIEADKPCLRLNNRGPEAVRAAIVDGIAVVQTWNDRLGWVTQAEHSNKDDAITDAENWY